MLTFACALLLLLLLLSNSHLNLVNKADATSQTLFQSFELEDKDENVDESIKGNSNINYEIDDDDDDDDHHQYYYYYNGHQNRRHHRSHRNHRHHRQEQQQQHQQQQRQRSISLNRLLDDSLVHELPETGEQVVISRGWPATTKFATSKQKRQTSSSMAATTTTTTGGRPLSCNDEIRVVLAAKSRRRHLISDEQKRRLLVEFLTRNDNHGDGSKLLVDNNKTTSGKLTPLAVEAAGGSGSGDASKINSTSPAKRRPSVRKLFVQYELGALAGSVASMEPIALPAARTS